MKIVLRHPLGLHIEFEGEADEFDRFERFLTGDLGDFMQGLDAQRLASGQDESESDSEANGDASRGPEDSHDAGGTIDTRVLHKRINDLGATTDIDRVTMITQAALDAGLEGANSGLADAIYDELGFPKPSRWAKAFHNAKGRGLLRSAGKHGYWRTTVQGENYAKHGIKPTAARRAKRPSGSSSDSPRLALEAASEEES